MNCKCGVKLTLKNGRFVKREIIYRGKVVNIKTEPICEGCYEKERQEKGRLRLLAG